MHRLLKAQDLITSPAHVVIEAAADEFYDKTTAPNQLWFERPHPHLRGGGICVVGQAGFGGVGCQSLSWPTRALARIRSFLATAVGATFFAFPAATRRA